MKNRNLRGFVSRTAYAAVLGIVSFLLGRVVPKNIFHADRLPFKCSEKEGRFCNALSVAWHRRRCFCGGVYPPRQRSVCDYPAV